MLGNSVMTLDLATHEVQCDGVTHALSAREFALLQALLLRPGAILSRAELEQRIYAWQDEIGSNAVEVIIHGVRRKLGAASIKNVRGAGWMVVK
jgi:two component transcriptional regulator, winged helix family